MRVKRVFEVLEASGTAIDPLESTPYSARIGSVMVQFGIRWRVMTE